MCAKQAKEKIFLIEKIDKKNGKLSYTLTYDKNLKSYPVSLILYVKTGDPEPKAIDLLQGQTINSNNQELTICYKESEIDDYYNLINKNKRLEKNEHDGYLGKWKDHGDTLGLKDGILYLLEKLKPEDAHSPANKSAPKQKADDEIHDKDKEKQESDKKGNTDINSTAITLETLNNLYKNVDKDSEEGNAINRRIDALNNLRKGVKTSHTGLSDAQVQIILDVFVPGNKEESDRKKKLFKHEKLKNIQSFDDFKRVAMSIINNSKK